MTRLLISVAVVVLARCAAGYTLPDQGIVSHAAYVLFCSATVLRLFTVLKILRLLAAQDALTFATQMRAVGPAWVEALESWNCPTPANSSNSSCDPCGVNSW